MSPRTLMVFAKAPTPGQVKTRLAAALGAEEAAKVYRRLGKQVVGQLLGGSYRMVIYYDPPDSERAIRRWLGPDHEYLPQPEGDLGRRLVHAFRSGFQFSEHVCVVGSDVPELGRTHVERAFSRLSAPNGPDGVIGPALDGGYYLLALRREAPALFDAIRWSTEIVYRETMERARSLDMKIEPLVPLADVDHPEDLPASLRTGLLPTDAGGVSRKPSGRPDQ